MRAIPLALWVAGGAIPAAAEPVAFDAARWRLSGEAELVAHRGRQALRIGNGRAILRGSSFDTGRIEYDILLGPDRSFPGLIFRGRDEGNYEEIYLRPHQSGNPDANQYAPVVNGVAAWQIFTGEGFGSAVSYPFGRWIRVRVDIFADSALLSLDGVPALRIPDLKRAERAGFIGFASNFAANHISNVEIVPIPAYADPSATAPAAPIPGLVDSWQVSSPMGESEALRRAEARDWTGLSWSSVPAETNGIANLARAGARTGDRATVIARFTVDAAAPRRETMRFGFSDRVTVFLNGRPLFSGDDSNGSRDYRFLGSVGFFDRLHLQLEAGANEIVFVVTEGFGGWAAAARLTSAPPGR